MGNNYNPYYPPQPSYPPQFSQFPEPESHGNPQAQVPFPTESHVMPQPGDFPSESHYYPTDPQYQHTEHFPSNQNLMDPNQVQDRGSLGHDLKNTVKHHIPGYHAYHKTAHTYHKITHPVSAVEHSIMRKIDQVTHGMVHKVFHPLKK